LRQVFAVVKNYPDLKASERFGQLQTELANTENRIQGRKTFLQRQREGFKRESADVPIEHNRVDVQIHPRRILRD